MLCSRLFAPRSFITRRHFRITTMIDPNLDLPALPTGHIRITEGSATMDYDEKEAVFYNKVQVFNRDLSIQVVKLFSEIREKEKKERYDKKYNNFLQAKERALAAGYQSQTEIRAKCHPLDTEMETIEVYVDPNAPLSSDKDISKDSKILRPPRPYREGISVLDALAATGLRSIRYMKEIPLIRSMVINDLIEDATIAAAKNCSQNQVDMSRVTINHGDAIEYMIQHADVEKQQQFDVIDLDPYGTAAPFLDSAVQSIADGGLICCTCTDMAVLSGNYPEKCFSLYGTVGLKSKFHHEAALRTLLHAIDSSANRHKKCIVPWISVSVDFYIRVFVRVFENASEVKKSLTRRMMVYQSTKCESFYLQPMGHTYKSKKGAGQTDLYAGAYVSVPSECPDSGGSFRLGGPYWAAPIHDQTVVDTILGRMRRHDNSITRNFPGSAAEDEQENEIEISTANGKDEHKDSKSDEEAFPYYIHTQSRIKSILGVISDELKDVPFYYTLPDLCSTVRCKPPVNAQFRSALSNAGYRFSGFHHEASAFKTDAPASVVWDILRAWCKLNPPLGSKHRKVDPSQDVGLKILSKEPATDVDFTLVEGTKRRKMINGEKNVLFPQNPEEHWGPKRKAGRAPLMKEGEKEGK